MNERKIQLALVSMLRSSVACACPNYTPIGWWECDLWAVTKAGYPVEYEIKVSVADFKADARKGRFEHKRGAVITKHAVILDHAHAPSRFYYAVPKDLAAEIEPLLPDWAGLVTVRDHHGYCLASHARTAPQLNKRKVSPREIVLAQRRMWYRYWEALRDIERINDDRSRRAQLANALGEQL